MRTWHPRHLPDPPASLRALRPAPLAASSLPSGFATVRSVLSGDTLVIAGTARPGAPVSELQLSLSGLAAPRLSRHPEQRDEPHAFASREFLRKIVIGRLVKFRVDYVRANAAGAGGGQRFFATVWLPVPTPGAAEGAPLAVPEGTPSLNYAREGARAVPLRSATRCNSPHLPLPPPPRC